MQAAEQDIDWEAIERSDAFQELVKQKRRYVLPRVVFFFGWYVAFVLLAGYAEDFMGESVYEGLTVGYLLALSQFVMVWVLAVTYVRKADRDFDPLEQKAIEHLSDSQRDGAGGAFRRDAMDAKPAPDTEVKS